jgi:putative ATP-binding cassette transporter
LIRLFELEGKVTLTENVFSTTDLSTGQRKRLALISALMENKPILVMDEWAADQDPYFRRKFYTEIVPQLKQDGLTIVAITHDDRYYHCADKVYKMEEGRMTEDCLNNYSSRSSQFPSPVLHK